MNYRALAYLATLAAESAELQEIYNAIEHINSLKASQLRARLSKQLERAALSAKERDFLDSAINNWENYKD